MFSATPITTRALLNLWSIELVEGKWVSGEVCVYDEVCRLAGQSGQESGS